MARGKVVLSFSKEDFFFLQKRKCHVGKDFFVPEKNTTWCHTNFFPQEIFLLGKKNKQVKKSLGFTHHLILSAEFYSFIF